MKSLISLLHYLLRLSDSKRVVTILGIAGVVSGALQTGLIAVINKSLVNGGVSALSLVLSFTILCLGLPIFRYLSQSMLIDLTSRAFCKIRLDLCQRILQSPLRRLEEIGHARLVQTVMNDVTIIITALTRIPLVAMHGSMIVASLVYLAWLDWRPFLFLLGMLAVGAWSYELCMRWARRYNKEAIAHRNELVKRVEALALGSKELKMNSERAASNLELLEAVTEKTHKLGAKSQKIFMGAFSWGQVLFFVAVGLLLFGLPNFISIEKDALIGYSFVIFLLMPPIETIFNTMPLFNEALIMIQHIEELELRLVSASPAPSASALPMDGVVELASVSYCYESATQNSVLGPISLTFGRGEITFIVGTAGSGKTTLAKIITGLYQPTGGQLLYGGRPISAENGQGYCQLFSAIFSDGHVFPDLLGIDDTGASQRVKSYLEQLHLSDKVELVGARFSKTELSQGERKRLALCHAWLEDRPFYLFDEWAAGQDPSYKTVFYRQILRDLKERGKTIIVISHDDAYFDVADRVLRLNSGVLTEDRRDKVHDDGPEPLKRAPQAARSGAVRSPGLQVSAAGDGGPSPG